MPADALYPEIFETIQPASVKNPRDAPENENRHLFSAETVNPGKSSHLDTFAYRCFTVFNFCQETIFYVHLRLQSRTGAI